MMNNETKNRIREILSEIPEYEQLGRDIAGRRKYRPSHIADVGVWSKAVAKIHPGRMKVKVTEKYPSHGATVIRMVRVADNAERARTFGDAEKDGIRVTSTVGVLPPFEAGAYVNVAVEKNGIRVGRPYSLCSSPAQRGYYEIAVGRKREGGFISDALINEVQPGDILEINEPSGRFVYNPVFHGKDLVFIAGGIGITPFISMIREKADLGLAEKKIHLVYGCRKLSDVPFLEELNQYAKELPGFEFTLVLSEPEEGWNGLTGFINCDNLKKAGITGKESFFYLCGPTAMYDFTIPELDKLGVPSKRIRREIIVEAGDISKDPGWPEAVDPETVFELIVEGERTIPAKAGETILVAMERAGMFHPSNCRGGECGLCRVELVSGKVFQTANAHMREPDRNYGNIYACSSYPIGNVTIRR